MTFTNIRSSWFSVISTVLLLAYISIGVCYADTSFDVLPPVEEQNLLTVLMQDQDLIKVLGYIGTVVCYTNSKLQSLFGNLPKEAFLTLGTIFLQNLAYIANDQLWCLCSLEIYVLKFFDTYFKHTDYVLLGILGKISFLLCTLMYKTFLCVLLQTISSIVVFWEIVTGAVLSVLAKIGLCVFGLLFALLDELLRNLCPKLFKVLEFVKNVVLFYFFGPDGGGNAGGLYTTLYSYDIGPHPIIGGGFILNPDVYLAHMQEVEYSHQHYLRRIAFVDYLGYFKHIGIALGFVLAISVPVFILK